MMLTARKTIGALTTAALAVLLFLVGCGGGTSGESSSTDTSSDSSTATEAQTADRQEIIGDHIVPTKDGVVVLPTSGLSITLPEDIASGDYNIAGWSRVSYEGLWSHLYIYDPNEDFASQVSQPSFYEIIGLAPDKSMEEFINEQVSSSTSELNEIPDGLLECYVDLGGNDSYHYYAMDQAKIAEVMPQLGSLESMAQYYEKDLGIPKNRIDQAMTLIPRFSDFVAGTQITPLTLPKVQKADDIDTAALANMTLKDLDGNDVRLGDIFAQNKVTMVDMWKTTCTVCVEDMPMLERLSKDYKDQGFGILSVCCDVVNNDGTNDEEIMYDAQDIVKTTGTTYPTVLANKEYRDLIDVVSTPTIIYVDSEGNIIDGPTRGSYPEDMTKEIVEGNLAKVQ